MYLTEPERTGSLVVCKQMAPGSRLEDTGGG
jgi:hypothetical protein